MLCFDMLSIGLIVPLITPFIRELGATPSQIGFISSVYGLTQLISSPILGRMSDTLSRRSIILVSLIGGAFGYLLLGLAQSIWMVVASRVVVGIFRQTMTVTKAWVTDIGDSNNSNSNNKKRHTTNYLSWFYATASLGFMIGPALGGKLASTYGKRLPFLLSTGLFLINALAVYSFMPSGKVVREQQQQRKSSTSPSLNSSTSSKSSKSCVQELATLKPKVRGLMLVRLFIGFSIMLSRSGIFMLMEYKLNMDVQNKGYIMSIYSIGGVVTQLLFIPFLVSCTNLSNRSLVVCSAVVLAGCQFMLGLMTTPRSFYAVIVGLACSSSVLKVAMSNALSNAAGKNNKGEVLGVAGSVMSVCRALSPMASGVLVETYDVVVPSYVAAGSMVVVVFLAPFFVPLEEDTEHGKHATTATTATTTK